MDVNFALVQKQNKNKVYIGIVEQYESRLVFRLQKYWLVF